MPQPTRAIDSLSAQLTKRLAELRTAGTYKRERMLDSPQGALIRVGDGAEVINLCANNYLGLANHPQVLAAAHRALDRYGYGCASVRFICGTQSIHAELESRLAASSAPRPRSSIRRASTPTADCSKPCSMNRTPSFPTP